LGLILFSYGIHIETIISTRIRPFLREASVVLPKLDFFKLSFVHTL